MKLLEAKNLDDSSLKFISSQNDLKKIPDTPISFWVSTRVREIFETSPSMGDVSNAVVGLQTGDNNRFLRFWQEVNIKKTGFGIENREQAQLSGKKLFPYNKGGDFRKWFFQSILHFSNQTQMVFQQSNVEEWLQIYVILFV